jgi:2'-phosphotransferase
VGFQGGGGGGTGGSKGKDKAKRGGGGGGGGKGGAKLRGLEKDSADVQISKTLSWLLRHGATGEGLSMRKDGYVKVDDLVSAFFVTSLKVEAHIYAARTSKTQSCITNLWQHPRNHKGRCKETLRPLLRIHHCLIPSSSSETPAPLAAFSESGELNEPSADGAWWIKANQGHSTKTVVDLNLKPIASIDDIPTGIAVHGTEKKGWNSIEKQGLSKMKRNHIHLAQGVAGQNVISGKPPCCRTIYTQSDLTETP